MNKKESPADVLRPLARGRWPCARAAIARVACRDGETEEIEAGPRFRGAPDPIHQWRWAPVSGRATECAMSLRANRAHRHSTLVEYRPTNAAIDGEMNRLEAIETALRLTTFAKFAQFGRLQRRACKLVMQ